MTEEEIIENEEDLFDMANEEKEDNVVIKRELKFATICRTSRFTRSPNKW